MSLKLSRKFWTRVVNVRVANIQKAHRPIGVDEFNWGESFEKRVQNHGLSRINKRRRNQQGD